jgi:hypothetical protein
MVEWSEDHVAAVGYFTTQHFRLVDKTWLNWRPGGALRKKWRQLVRKVREWYAVSRHLQDCSPRLCLLRTDGLTLMSKYWMYQSHAGDMGPISIVSKYWMYQSHAGDMSPVSLVACCRQMFGFLHCFIGWLRRETGYGRTDRSAGVLWIVSGALFLGSSDSVQRCRRLTEGCYALTAWDTYDLGPYVDWAWKACWSGFPVQDVHQFESPWLSDMSNRLFVVVIT